MSRKSLSRVQDASWHDRVFLVGAVVANIGSGLFAIGVGSDVVGVGVAGSGSSVVNIFIPTRETRAAVVVVASGADVFVVFVGTEFAGADDGDADAALLYLSVLLSWINNYVR